MSDVGFIVWKILSSAPSSKGLIRYVPDLPYCLVYVRTTVRINPVLINAFTGGGWHQLKVSYLLICDL